MQRKKMTQRSELREQATCLELQNTCESKQAPSLGPGSSKEGDSLVQWVESRTVDQVRIAGCLDGRESECNNLALVVMRARAEKTRRLGNSAEMHVTESIGPAFWMMRRNTCTSLAQGFR